jgi:hypothetical protein
LRLHKHRQAIAVPATAKRFVLSREQRYVFFFSPRASGGQTAKDRLTNDCRIMCVASCQPAPQQLLMCEPQAIFAHDGGQKWLFLRHGDAKAASESNFRASQRSERSVSGGGAASDVDGGALVDNNEQQWGCRSPGAYPDGNHSVHVGLMGATFFPSQV